jgi:hypothetical protein
VFRELEPYPLFPVDEYFCGPSRIGPTRAVVARRRTDVPEHLSFPRPIGKTA